MAQVKIFNQETNSYYTITFDLKQSVLDDTGDGDIDYYITVKTTIPTLSGGTFPTFRIRTMDDSPPGPTFSTAFDFNQLCQQYITYFTVEAQLAQSSSSSSSISSDSSSSYGFTSSSSSLGESSSSSSWGESSSSSS